MRAKNLIAAVCFGLAALAVAMVFFVVFHFYLTALALTFYLALPALAGTIGGWLVGSAILDESRTRNVWMALGWGALTSLVSYLLFPVLFAIGGYLRGPAATAILHSSPLKQAYATFAIGLLFAVPLALPVGMITGVLLYLVRTRAARAATR